MNHGEVFRKALVDSVLEEHERIWNRKGIEMRKRMMPIMLGLLLLIGCRYPQNAIDRLHRRSTPCKTSASAFLLTRDSEHIIRPSNAFVKMDS